MNSLTISNKHQFVNMVNFDFQISRMGINDNRPLRMPFRQWWRRNTAAHGKAWQDVF